VLDRADPHGWLELLTSVSFVFQPDEDEDDDDVGGGDGEDEHPAPEDEPLAFSRPLRPRKKGLANARLPHFSPFRFFR